MVTYSDLILIGQLIVAILNLFVHISHRNNLGGAIRKSPVKSRI